jgi:hypothetical protein
MLQPVRHVSFYCLCLSDIFFEEWPVPRHLREFFALLYNRQPIIPADIDARVTFKSTHDPTMANKKGFGSRG